MTSSAAWTSRSPTGRAKRIAIVVTENVVDFVALDAADRGGPLLLDARRRPRTAGGLGRIGAALEDWLLDRVTRQRSASTGVTDAHPGTWLRRGVRSGTEDATDHKEANMAGMIKKLMASGIAAKVIQEARKPENQAKIKKADRGLPGQARPAGTPARARY